MAPPQLFALGFCGADDSVHPHQLALIARAYPLTEFGVLLRPDLEGQPRYATAEWLQALGATAARFQAATGTTMKLAAHLCGSRVNDVLQGRADDYLEHLASLGFQRVQINATAVNGVDTSRLQESVPLLYAVFQKFAGRLEFILQKNQETRPLWSGIEELLEKQQDNPVTNIAMLVDESKGTGVLSLSWPVPESKIYKTGYAGGLGPNNISKVLPEILKAVEAAPTECQQPFWIDMESSLRSIKNGQDVFDLDKCFAVIDQVCTLNLMERPDYLQTS